MLLGLGYVILAGLLNLRTGRDIGMFPLQVIFLGCVILLIVGLVLGVVGLVRIGQSAGRLTGRGFAIIGILIPLGLGGLGVLISLQEHARSVAHYPMHCGTNLSQIGKAMMIYANDYEDRFPTAGGRGTVWGPGLSDWKAGRRAEAFGLDPNGAGGQATISSSLFLLVKYGEVSPDVFVCRGDRRVKELKPGKYGVSADRLTDLWDFGPNPARHCSYAYHLPYGAYALTAYSHPGLAVAADRNPWMASPGFKVTEFSLFKPDVAPFDGTAEEAQQGNALAHGREGQNVLYMDSHVEFNKRASSGLDDDNVYTSWDGDDARRGVPPKPYDSRPANEFDSLLVNDPPLNR